MHLSKILDQLQIIRVQNKQCTEDVEVQHKSFWFVNQVYFPNHLKEHGDLYKQKHGNTTE